MIQSCKPLEIHWGNKFDGGTELAVAGLQYFTVYAGIQCPGRFDGELCGMA